jgi:hypothetical protein
MNPNLFTRKTERVEQLHCILRLPCDHLAQSVHRHKSRIGASEVYFRDCGLRVRTADDIGYRMTFIASRSSTNERKT